MRYHAMENKPLSSPAVETYSSISSEITDASTMNKAVKMNSAQGWYLYWQQHKVINLPTGRGKFMEMTIEHIGVMDQPNEWDVLTVYLEDGLKFDVVLVKTWSAIPVGYIQKANLLIWPIKEPHLAWWFDNTDGILQPIV